jgi:uncharacterized OsmC-like protein
MATATAQKVNRVNGLDVDALTATIAAIEQDPAKGMVEFRVRSEWKGQACSETSIDSYTIGGQVVKRPFKVRVDEPLELLGQNTAPNPQEMLMTALNACVMVGYVAGAAVRGITLEKLEIETSGGLDLRGFLGIDPNVRPGYEMIRYTVHIKGNGTPEQFRQIHETVLRTSPNYFNISRPIRVETELKIEA